MSWENTVTEEAVLEQVRVDHGMTQARHLTYRRKQLRPLGGFVMFDRGYAAGWWDAVAWVLHAQGEFESLTTGEALAELRKGRGSIYYALFRDDGVIPADCPNHGLVTIGKEGYCDACGYDFDR